MHLFKRLLLQALAGLLAVAPAAKPNEVVVKELPPAEGGAPEQLTDMSEVVETKLSSSEKGLVFIPFCPNVCTASQMIIGCDGRTQGPTSNTAGSSPWQMVGRFTGSGIGSCTGTLIGPKHVLTAAHCVLNGSNQFRSGPIGFRLGQFSAGPCGQPYGTHYAVRVFVRKDYNNSSIAAENKASDWAVVELANPIPGATAMSFDYLSWGTIQDNTPYSVGYPGDKATGTIWQTGSVNSFPLSPHRWLDGGDKGLLYVTNDGVGGQSGSPIYVFQSGQRELVGVFLGSPIADCQDGRTWAARLTTGAVSRIQNSMKFPPNGNVLDFSLRWKNLSPSEWQADVPPSRGCGF